MALTALGVKNLKPKDRSYRKPDFGGLSIEVAPTGARLWRWRYRFNGKPQLLSFGKYPAVSLEEARRKRDEARQLLDIGKNPSTERKAEKARGALSCANTFDVVARAWHMDVEPTLDAKYHKIILRRFELYVFPEIGFLPIGEITTPDVVRVVKNIAKRGTIETARRMKRVVSQIFRYATLLGLCQFNPAADLRGLLPKKKKKHHACVKPEEMPELLRAIEGYKGGVLTKAALKLVALTFVRTNELIGARWSEIDFERAEWNIPEERMKMRRPHFVPLSTQNLAILKELHAITGTKEYIFHSQRGKTSRISNGAMLMALRRLKYAGRMTGHGFRTLASTILNEEGYRKDAIEAQLAHGDEDEIRSAYNHAEYRHERIKMMQDWADMLDAAKLRKSNVIYLPMNDLRGTKHVMNLCRPVSGSGLVIGWNLLVHNGSEITERDPSKLILNAVRRQSGCASLAREGASGSGP